MLQPNLGSLQELQVLLTTELSLEPRDKGILRRTPLHFSSGVLTRMFRVHVEVNEGLVPLVPSGTSLKQFVGVGWILEG